MSGYEKRGDTVFSPRFEESCHNEKDPRSETRELYIEGCQILERHLDEEITIFEVGLGTCLGLEMTKEALKERPFHFISSEIDPYFIDEALRKFPKLHDHMMSQKLKSTGQCVDLKTTLHMHFSPHQRFTLLCGDLRHTIKKIPSQSVHAIYQDAFSPKKNPALWTREFFNELYRIGHKDVILSTFSSHKGAQLAMIEAGFKVHQLKGSQGKKRSTRAYKSGESNLTQEQIQDRTSLKDSDLNKHQLLST